MSIPTSEPLLPEDENRLPPARRRRVRRSLLPAGGDERAAFLEQLAHQVTPGYEFFLFTFFAGVVLGVAVWLDSPALYLLAALIAPFLGPALGLSLAVVVGSGRFFLKALSSLAIACLIIFGLGVLAGGIGKAILPGNSLSMPVNFSLFSIPNFIVLGIGVGLANYMLVRSPRQKPLVASVAIAYELLLPLGVAGFSLSYGLPGSWMDGVIVFIIHLAWSALVGSIVLFAMGLKPANVFGYTLGSSIILIGLIAAVLIIGLMMAQPVVVATLPTGTPTPTLTSTLPSQATLPPSPSPSSLPPTFTPTATIQPTFTPTVTVTPQPTPVWARVNAPQSDGAIVREEPGGRALTSLLNGSLVQVISEPVRGEGSTIWVQVRTENGLVGWMVQALLATATPAPAW
ncbi:predicted membrane protein [Bellilinea caldifistulae]|uniref:SH3b domain-containing protein n=1 Tax=Bellilinea caldifistulae TaxID=360411 RepID=A0A0P6Y2R0_9CHLR|nr:SH3 domain-containing protein [Bellilinea caldifistulae]KPL75943.1 hypothetical protein AC812_08245 [Bellilinea caldifistulae]GAP11511.1 predicted membrane protein [Bellilinea caldifistulae]